MNISKMNPARVDREDERRMLPCRNFLDGYCPKGSRCRFYHPLPSAIPTVTRVPNLPSSFQETGIGPMGHFPLHTGRHSMFHLGARSATSLDSPRSARSNASINGKIRIGTPGLLGEAVRSRLLGMNSMNGLGNNFSRVYNNVPISPTYSEYEMAYAQEMEIQKEKERQAAAPPIVEPEENIQNTVFSHIDWKQFLAPGVQPPPPTHVPCTGLEHDYSKAF